MKILGSCKNGLLDIEDFSLVVNSCEIYELSFLKFHKCHMKRPHDCCMTVLKGFVFLKCLDYVNRKYKIVKDGIMTLHTCNQVLCNMLLDSF